jgi:hypothetical protein
VPNTEVCNNGLDDDGDGLVDGALSGADPCAAPVDARGQTVRIGTCSRGAAEPSCDDTATIATPANPSDSSEWADELGTFNRQVTLDYAYAMDREEVSIRAYRECVQSGCCLEPIGPIWRKAVVAMDAGLSPTRPAAPPTDVATVDVNDPDQAALLPVHLAPVGSRTIVGRVLNNLQVAAGQTGDLEVSAAVQRIRVLLSGATLN